MWYDIANIVHKVAEAFRGFVGIVAGVDGTNVVRPLLTDSTGAIEIAQTSNPGSPVVYNVAMAVKNTEYSQVIPAGVQCISFQLRLNKVLRFAFVTGKVAGPVAPYATVKAGGVYTCDGLTLQAPTTLYVAGPDDAQVCEIVVWS